MSRSGGWLGSDSQNINLDKWYGPDRVLYLPGERSGSSRRRRPVRLRRSREYCVQQLDLVGMEHMLLMGCPSSCPWAGQELSKCCR